VVSGSYDDTDMDLGDKILYSSAGSATTSAATADLSKTGTKALIRSIHTRNPVRVLRSSSGKGALAPRAGLRYDGLYVVSGFETMTNKKGGEYARFRLDRMDGQVAVNTAAPTPAQTLDFEQVSLGF
jgi:putative restriction endonuclease